VPLASSMERAGELASARFGMINDAPPVICQRALLRVVGDAAAEYLRVSTQRPRRWDREGRLAAMRRPIIRTKPDKYRIDNLYFVAIT